MNRLFPLLPMLLMAACAREIPIENAPCPCAVGWTCCEGDNVCVREGSSCPGPVVPEALTISPDVLKVGLGRNGELIASEEVVWQVVAGAELGSIDGQGHFSAGLRPGVARVRATSVKDPLRVADADVHVGPRSLELLAGRLGGHGNLDGVGSEARIGNVGGMVGDGKGHLFIADSSRSWFDYGSASVAVRRIEIATGKVETIAELSTDDNEGWGPIAYGGDDELFVFRFTPRTRVAQLVRVNAKTGSMVTMPAPMGATALIGLVVQGEWLIGASSGSFLFRMSLLNGASEVLLGSPTESGIVDGESDVARFTSISALVADSAGQLLAMDKGTNECLVRRIDVTQRTVVTTERFPTPIMGSCPTQLALIDGVLLSPRFQYAAGPAGDTNQQIGVGPATEKTGYLTWKWESVESGFDELYWVSGAAHLWSEGHTLYIGDGALGVIRQLSRVEASQGLIVLNGDHRIVAGSEPHATKADGVGENARFLRPTHLASDSKGNVYVSERRALNTDWPGIAQLSATGLVIRLAQPPLTYIQTFTIGDDDQLLLTDGSSLFRVSPVDSSLSEIKPSAPNNYDMPTPFYLADSMATDGEAVFVADDDWGQQQHRLRRFDLKSNEVSTVARWPVDWYTSALAVDGLGKAYVAVQVENGAKLLRIDLASGDREELPIPDLGRVGALAYDSVGILYFSEPAQARVRARVLASGNIFEVVGANRRGVRLGTLPASLNTPVGLAVLPTGALVISDREENAVLIAR